jgi:hypothetical protein
MSEIKTYILAYLDVLGFTKLVEEKGLEEIYKMYENLIEKVNSVVERYRPGGYTVPVPVSKTEVRGGFCVNFEIEYAYASDTILVWCEFNRFNIVPFLKCITTLFCSALEIEIPLRGTITFGDAALSKSKSIYIGKPIIEGAICEKWQAWMGITFGKSLIDDVKYGWLGDLKNIIPFSEHIKTTGEAVDFNAQYGIINIVIDWARFVRTEGKNEKILQWLESKKNDPLLSSNVRDYYAQTVKFMKYSQENQDWYNYFDFQQSRLGGYVLGDSKHDIFVYNSSEEEWSNNTAGVLLVRNLLLATTLNIDDSA